MFILLIILRVRCRESIKKLPALSQYNHIILILTWQHTQALSSCIIVNYNLLAFRIIRLFLTTHVSLSSCLFIFFIIYISSLAFALSDNIFHILWVICNCHLVVNYLHLLLSKNLQDLFKCVCHGVFFNLGKYELIYLSCMPRKFNMKVTLQVKNKILAFKLLVQMLDIKVNP